VTATTVPFCRHIDRIAGGRKSVHVPNGALDSLLEAPEVPPPDEGPFLVGYLGNFGIAQGLRIVLDAADLLRDEPIRFVLVGAGPLAEALEQERDRRDLHAVSFHPPVPVDELPAFMQQFHALLVPLGAQPLLSDFVPSKLYDAMAIGRPAIVAARGEAAALIEGAGAGLTIPPEDGPALSEAVRALARDPQRASAMAASGRAAAADHVRSRQLERIDQILRTAANGRPR
jgi:glycosyltransferase involved in cell wall biosynthesis